MRKQGQRTQCLGCNQWIKNSSIEPFCNDVCKLKFENAKDILCVGCNKFLQKDNIKIKKIYCSKECYWQSKQVIKICLQCLIEFKVRKCESDKKLCSEECAKEWNRSDFIKEQRKNTMAQTLLNKYNVEYTWNIPGVFEKGKITNLEKYGDENYHNSDKMRKTKLERYGNETFTNSIKAIETRNKNKQEVPTYYNESYKQAIQTKLNKYGSLNFIDKANETFIKNYGITRSEYYQNISFKDKYKKLKEKYKNIAEFLFTEDEYKGYRSWNLYKFKCTKCQTEYTSNISDRGPWCSVCHPRLNGISIEENKLLEFIKSIYNKEIICHSKQIISPYELDIYLPDINLAIEFNGVYWHSEKCNKDKNYHLNKTNLCLKQGITLIHIFEDEWLYKQDIIKSILSSYINSSFKNKIYARNTEIKQISAKECNEFLENNHLQGKDRSSIRYGLFKDNILISVMTFVKSRYNKNYQYEINRYATLLNTNISGGAEKLFSHFIIEYSPVSIITYSDRRFFRGNIYKKLGFEFSEYTKPNYFYVINNQMVNRQNFQKHKLPDILEKFDLNLSEVENMKLNGYYRIWDCGNSKWTWNKKSIETN